MRPFHRYLILLLAIATGWIHYTNHKAFQEFPRPFFAAMDSLKLENLLLQQDLTARQATLDQLTQQVSTLTAQLQTQQTPAQGQITPAQPVPVSTPRSFDTGARPQLVSMQTDSMQNSDPWGQDLTQSPARAQTLQYAASATNPTATADDYWQQIQEISEKYIIGREDKTKFLQEGSKLIQKLQEAQQTLQVDLASIQFLEVRANDEGIDGILKMNEAKKKMAEQATLIEQYQRDIETLINPYKTASSTLKMPGTLTPNVGQPATRYSHLSMESEIVITQNRTFLVTLHFFFTDNKSDPPQLMSVTDIFNLSTMQSTSKQFFYPDYFLKDIYELVRKAWRDQGVKWNRKPTTEDLQVFLTVINHE